MEKEQIKNYTLRISQASRSELVVIIYDIIIYDIDDALKQGIENIDDFRRSIKHGLKFVNELMSTLDFKYMVSFNLMQLYEYCQRILVACSISTSPDINSLISVCEVMKGLKEVFTQVSRQDKSGAVMENTQQIYAGLTYGRNSLNEADLDPNSVRRGFLA